MAYFHAQFMKPVFADDISQVARMLQKKSKERTANNCKNNNS